MKKKHGLDGNKLVDNEEDVLKNIRTFVGHDVPQADRRRTLKNRMHFIAYKNDDKYMFAPVDFGFLKNHPNLKKAISIPHDYITELLGVPYEQGNPRYEEIYAAYEVYCVSKGTNANALPNTRHFWLIDSDGLRPRPSARNALQPNSNVNTFSQDIENIYLDETIDATARQTLINARVGQGKFREWVMNRWGGACAFSGCKTQQALRASHIKPWSECSNEDRLDPANGLMLTANIDALFDRGLLSFEDDGQILICSLLSIEDRELLGIRDGRLLREPDEAECGYLAYHRKEIFIG